MFDKLKLNIMADEGFSFGWHVMLEVKTINELRETKYVNPTCTLP